MEENKKHSPYLLSTVNNALKVLDILSVRDNSSLAELARYSGLDKTSLFKILYTLESRDYVFKTADARYRLGSKFAAYGELAAERQSLEEIAMPYMRRVQSRFRETVYLGVLNVNGKVIMVHMEAGSGPDSIVTRVGYEIEAHCNAMGKVLLAWLEPGIQRSIVERLSFKRYTDTTITTPQALYPALEEIHSRGWGEDASERYPGHSALSVPVFDGEGRCVAALSIVCTEKRFAAGHDEMLSELLAAADMISRRLGA